LITSFIGTYLFVRGISLFVGGFPPEYLIYEMIKSGVGITQSFYYYLGGIILGFIF